MIRDFQYNPDAKLIIETLQKFGFNLAHEKYPFSLLRFDVISPDSFMWRILIGEGVYYLYAEDYVSGLDYIKRTFQQYLEASDWEFVRPLKTVAFEDAGPVTRANVYAKADDSDAMMEYAVDSGYDFVFLVKSSEKPEDAQFSKHSPRGFGREA